MGHDDQERDIGGTARASGGWSTTGNRGVRRRPTVGAAIVTIGLLVLATVIGWGDDGAEPPADAIAATGADASGPSDTTASHTASSDAGPRDAPHPPVVAPESVDQLAAMLDRGEAEPVEGIDGLFTLGAVPVVPGVATLDGPPPLEGAFTLSTVVEGSGGHAIAVPFGAALWRAGDDPTELATRAAAEGIDLGPLPEILAATPPDRSPYRTAWVGDGPDGAAVHVRVVLEHQDADGSAEDLVHEVFGDAAGGEPEVSSAQLPLRPDVTDVARIANVRPPGVFVAAYAQVPAETELWVVECEVVTDDPDAGSATCDDVIASFAPFPST